MAPAKTDTNWSVNYDVLRREHLFKNPPKDRTAYPALAASIKPHVDSFNALFEDSKILQAGLKDIGTKTFIDGEAETPEQKKARQAEGRKAPKRNKLHVRIKEVFLEKPAIPPTNKFTTRNRNIYPSECREGHATYRGKLRARIEYRVNNGDWMEAVRELGQVPIMMRVSSCSGSILEALLILAWLTRVWHRRIDAIWRRQLPRNLLSTRKSQRNWAAISS